jgi:CopG family transcriptional regulator, nickel-responsive regulator
VTLPPAPLETIPMAKLEKVARFSISLPAGLAAQLDGMVGARGFKNRSQAISEMVRARLSELKVESGTGSTAGTISLIYDYRKRNMQTTLSAIQHRYYLLIVSSMHVHLEHHQYLEVLLVQGPPRQVRRLADELITCKGVRHGKLQLTAIGIPPLL